jgi:hypothetical protein
VLIRIPQSLHPRRRSSSLSSGLRLPLLRRLSSSAWRQVGIFLCFGVFILTSNTSRSLQTLLDLAHSILYLMVAQPVYHTCLNQETFLSLLLLKMRKRAPPRNRTLLLIASKLEVTHHHSLRVLASSLQRIQFQPNRSRIVCRHRWMRFVHEPAGIAVEPSIGLFQTAAAGFD